MAFPIIEISPDSVTGDEQLGSKPKFWFVRDDERWLFKERRQNTGEDWAEKLASHIAVLVGVPSAQVELAVCAGRIGCASRTFVEEGENLLHGNEILAGQIIGYDRGKQQHHSDHTLRNIVSAVQQMLPEPVMHDRVLRTLAGYMTLDALIGNTDRHHENWGFVMRFDQEKDGAFGVRLRVAPSFDHASSLGRELQDDRRLNILNGIGIARYARAGRGGVYLESTDRHGANPISLIQYGMQHYSQYFRPALQGLQ
jgi:hypothetical protein